MLDLSDVAGALCSRVLGDLGADVVRSPAGAAELARLARAADVIVGARALDDEMRIPSQSPRTIVVEITPFGASGPRASWRGSDLVCAARGGMVFVNGHPGSAPIAPFGLAAYTSAALFGVIATLLALRVRDATGRGSRIDVSVAAAAAGAVEHVTGLLRQTGEIERRRGTLHWSRTFRVGPARDGLVLHSLLGDWTTLAEWVESRSTGNGVDLRDPRWEDPEARKQHAEELFDRIDRWSAEHPAREIAEAAGDRRLPATEVRRPEDLATNEQLVGRGFLDERTIDGDRVVFPGAPFRMSATPLRLRRLAPRPGEHDEEVRRDPAWSGEPVLRSAPNPTNVVATPPATPLATPRATPLRRPLDGVTILDFTWVVAGPVATRILADHGARVLKVEHRRAADFGTRRGGLTGNLNRGKQSLVLDLASPDGRALAHRLAARADVVIDNFSARVMDGFGLDWNSLRERRADAIAVRLTGFGLDGPWRDRVSYGPTLQALTGLPYLMRLPGGEPAGWGYSWSDMVGGMAGALAALAALHHRDRTGEGQLVDLGQLENLVAWLGPRVVDLLAGRSVEPPGNASQEGAAAPHGIYPCAPEHGANGANGADGADGADGVIDDDRWIAIAVLDDEAWRRLKAELVADGEAWAGAEDLRTLAGRLSRAEAIEARIAAWTRRFRAADLEERLQAAGVAAGLVANGRDLEDDVQLAHRGYFATVATPEGGRERFDGIPFVASACPGAVEAPGPLLGEHTDEILRDLLSLAPEEIARLRAQEVIG